MDGLLELLLAGIFWKDNEFIDGSIFWKDNEFIGGSATLVSIINFLLQVT